MAWNWPLPKVLPLSVHSGNISFSEWVVLLTLCFAPIIAHLIAGTPQPTYLNTNQQRQPKWHDYLCLYSPISIIWRYAAIADRRIRSRTWRPVDMAAANAIFWTDKGWDGSEEMATRSVRYCVTPPPSSHASLLSWEFLKTAIVTLQGVQALYVFGGGITGATKMPRFALDTIFFPAAFLGLLRLFAASWLTSEYVYAPLAEDRIHRDINEGESESHGDINSHAKTKHERYPSDTDDETFTYPDAKTLLSSTFQNINLNPNTTTNPELTSGPSSVHDTITTPNPRYRNRLSLAFKFIYITPVLLLFFISLAFLVPGPWQDAKKYPKGRTFSLTTFIGNIYAIFFFFTIAATYTYHAWTYGCRSTIIPCISRPWYKILVGITFAGLIPLLTISALETRRTPCGVWTTGGKGRDEYTCEAFVVD